MSISSGDPINPNNLGKDREKMKVSIKTLLDNDVPVFVSAGNSAQIYDDDGNLRPNVDTSPANFEGPDYPLIVVGATDFTGTPAPFSQAGDHVQVWAPGVGIQAQDKDSDNALTKGGISYAAPLMAGVLANFLAYKPVPFDTTPGKLAAAAKQYLIDHGNWQRQPGTKVIWKEVDEDHNPKKSAASPVGPAPGTAPYAQGTCGLQVTEWKATFDDSGNYDLEVLMTDNNKTQIGYTQRTQANASVPLYFQSRLEDELECIPEAHHDYIQFALGAQQWPSDGKFAPGAIPSCNVPAQWSGDAANGKNVVSVALWRQ